MLDYDFIEKKAKESKIDDITIEREYWQLLFLQRLYLRRGSEKIFFKGGTAIRFLFGSFRFSEDLDFTSLLKRGKVEELFFETFYFFRKNVPFSLEFKKERVFKKLEDVSLRYKFLFLPRGLKHKVSLRIDISLREKPLTSQQSVLVPFDYPISPYPLVVHLAAPEILAEKVRAILVRGRPRDLFDLWFLLSKKIPFDGKMIKKKLKIYPGLKFSLPRLRRIIGSFEEKKLKKDLNQFLPENYRSFYKILPHQTLKLL